MLNGFFCDVHTCGLMTFDFENLDLMLYGVIPDPLSVGSGMRD